MLPLRALQPDLHEFHAALANISFKLKKTMYRENLVKNAILAV